MYQGLWEPYALIIKNPPTMDVSGIYGAFLHCWLPDCISTINQWKWTQGLSRPNACLLLETISSDGFMVLLREAKTSINTSHHLWCSHLDHWWVVSILQTRNIPWCWKMALLPFSFHPPYQQISPYNCSCHQDGWPPGKCWCHWQFDSCGGGSIGS